MDQDHGIASVLAGRGLADLPQVAVGFVEGLLAGTDQYRQRSGIGRILKTSRRQRSALVLGLSA